MRQRKLNKWLAWDCTFLVRFSQIIDIAQPTTYKIYIRSCFDGLDLMQRPHAIGIPEIDFNTVNFPVCVCVCLVNCVFISFHSPIISLVSAVICKIECILNAWHAWRQGGREQREWSIEQMLYLHNYLSFSAFSHSFIGISFSFGCHVIHTL